MSQKLPTVVVLNMYYTGLGIARTLGERGIPVIGLTAGSRVYGSLSRYVRAVSSPDSRSEPEALLACLLELGKTIGQRSVLFPTRDDDVVFLDRFRRELEPYYSLVVPQSSAVAACLDKWQTYLWAQRAHVAMPKCWLIETPQDLPAVARETAYPCVLKPLSAHHWHQGQNWQIVGGRKVIGIASCGQLLAEYAVIAQADQRALLQEMVEGGDDCLVVTACYIDRGGQPVAAFNTQKLLQQPEKFGTGCIVQAVSRPELFEPTFRLLRAIQFTGIAEVEYKWNAASGAYELVEINPRPWDQHMLGRTCGVDLIYLAYCDHAGLPVPIVRARPSTWKWVADDGFILTGIRALCRRKGSLRTLLRLARGRRIYGIWSARDPLPFLYYFLLRLIPRIIGAALRQLGSVFTSGTVGPAFAPKGGSAT